MEELQKEHCHVLNQIFEIEKKMNKLNVDDIDRNLQRMKNIFDNMGLSFHDPLNEPYNEMRTDCEASISGDSTENLVITEVIKPIIHFQDQGRLSIIQKAVVIAETKR